MVPASFMELHRQSPLSSPNRVTYSSIEILGHEKLSMSYCVYSLGLDLRGLQRVVEKIAYKGVKSCPLGSWSVRMAAVSSFLTRSMIRGLRLPLTWPALTGSPISAS